MQATGNVRRTDPDGVLSVGYGLRQDRLFGLDLSAGGYFRSVSYRWFRNGRKVNTFVMDPFVEGALLT